MYVGLFFAGNNDNSIISISNVFLFQIVISLLTRYITSTKLDHYRLNKRKYEKLHVNLPGKVKYMKSITNAFFNMPQIFLLNHLVSFLNTTLLFNNMKHFFFQSFLAQSK